MILLMKNANVVALLACCATVLSFAIAPAARPAGDLRRGSMQIDRKSAADVARVRDYRPILQECRDATGVVKLAIRRMSINYSILLLLVDSTTLETSVESAAGWSCSETSDAAQSETRYMRALRAKSEGPQLERNGALQNVGLGRGAGRGVFLTGDLCPSRRPLDRGFFDLLAREGAAAEAKTPLALAVSGLWIATHPADFAWLQEKTRAGALEVTWVNHSYHHPYAPDRPDQATYLLTPGIDAEAEILNVERLLIALGATPSAFFRFPGLVANEALIELASRLHLIALGADSWLVLGPAPRDGSIVLVHPNGNEPAGLRLFSHLLEQGRLPRPFRAINEAP
jgi:hypothetical protein